MTSSTSTSFNPSSSTVLECVGVFTETINGGTFILFTPVPTSEATQSNVVCAPVVLPTDGSDSDGPSSASATLISIVGPGLVSSTATNTGDGVSNSLPEATASGSSVSSTNVSHSRNVTGPVVGSIVGALVASLILGWVFVAYRRRRRSQAKHAWARAPGKWSFRDRKAGEPPHEMNVTSPTP